VILAVTGSDLLQVGERDDTLERGVDRYFNIAECGWCAALRGGAVTTDLSVVRARLPGKCVLSTDHKPQGSHLYQ